MKPRSPSTGGKGQFPQTDYFFHSGFGQWQRRLFFALRRRGKIRIQKFLQFRTRIPYRSCSGTRQGNGGICTDCSDLGLAGALHGGHSGEAVEQGPSPGSVAVFFDLFPAARRSCATSLAREIRPGIRAFFPEPSRGVQRFRSRRAGLGNSANNLRHRLWCHRRSS